jgi:hypothetical protein
MELFAVAKKHLCSMLAEMNLGAVPVLGEQAARCMYNRTEAQC